jgi:hypothetical protein
MSSFLLASNERKIISIPLIFLITVVFVELIRQTTKTTEWIDAFSRKHNVNLAIIYDDWFNTIPENWNKIAELSIGKMKISA